MSDTIARFAAFGAKQNVQFQDLGFSDRLSPLTEFGPNPGALRAKLYLPDNLVEAAPLVVVLHGCTQTAAGYDHGSGWSRLADEAGFALLFPEQQRANNPNLCFNWFVPTDTKRDSGEALSIRHMVETMVAVHGADRRRIFVTGLSAGGAMASVMLATYPEVFAGGAIIAGLPYGSANTVPEAFDRMRGHGGPSEQDLQWLCAVRHHITARGRGYRSGKGLPIIPLLRPMRRLSQANGALSTRLTGPRPARKPLMATSGRCGATPTAVRSSNLTRSPAWATAPRS